MAPSDERDKSDLTHLDAHGRARMVDVSEKQTTLRTATARATLEMQRDTLMRIREGSLEKGDVLAIAQVSAVMAAKRTADVIPLCHPIFLSGVDVSFSFPSEEHLSLDVTVRTKSQTGVEMEALTAAGIGALTVYDMCKAIDRSMCIRFVGLLEKRGGKSGDYVRHTLYKEAKMHDGKL